jgi:hypothetical protein
MTPNVHTRILQFELISKQDFNKNPFANQGNYRISAYYSGSLKYLYDGKNDQSNWIASLFIITY